MPPPSAETGRLLSRFRPSGAPETRQNVGATPRPLETGARLHPKSADLRSRTEGRSDRRNAKPSVLLRSSCTRPRGFEPLTFGSVVGYLQGFCPYLLGTRVGFDRVLRGLFLPSSGHGSGHGALPVQTLLGRSAKFLANRVPISAVSTTSESVNRLFAGDRGGSRGDMAHWTTRPRRQTSARVKPPLRAATPRVPSSAPPARRPAHGDASAAARAGRASTASPASRSAHARYRATRARWATRFSRSQMRSAASR